MKQCAFTRLTSIKSIYDHPITRNLLKQRQITDTDKDHGLATIKLSGPDSCFKVIGQTVQAGEHRQKNGWTDGRTDGRTDATKQIISPASWSIINV